MSSLSTFLDHWVDTITPGEKEIKTNKHAVVILRLLGDVSAYFLKQSKILSGSLLLMARLSLMKPIYFKSALKCDSFDVTIGIKLSFF